MFAPLGYVPVSVFFEKFLFDKNGDIRNLKAAKDMAQSLAKDETISQPLWAFFSVAPADWAEVYMFGAIENRIHIASPTGEILKLDTKTVRSAIDQWSITSCDLFTAIDNEEISTEEVYEITRQNRLFDIPPREFIQEYQQSLEQGKDWDAWTFADKELHASYLHHILPAFYERQFYTISLQAYNSISQTKYIGPEDVKNAARILKPFEGWALCITEAFYNEEVPKILARMDEEGKDTLAIKSGRPPALREDMKKAYNALFPSGNHRSWFYALRRVQEHLGTNNGSVATLKRAVAGQNSPKSMQNSGQN